MSDVPGGVNTAKIVSLLFACWCSLVLHGWSITFVFDNHLLLDDFFCVLDDAKARLSFKIKMMVEPIKI